MMHGSFQLNSPNKVVSEAVAYLTDYFGFQLSSPNQVVSEAVADQTDYFGWHQ